jgi:hypothetical protein
VLPVVESQVTVLQELLLVLVLVKELLEPL